MRVFVTGATGAIGRPLVARLVGAGHDVVGMTRSAERAEQLRAQGAEAVVCDAYDRDALTRAMTEARPEVVVNELTDIPPVLDPRRYAEQMAGLNRIRREAYPIVAAAAEAAGARRLVAQSISFVYAPGDGPATEDDPAWLEAGPPFDETLEATLAGERAVLESAVPERLVLRYGWFYGPGTSFAPDGGQTQLIRSRRFPVIGDGAGVWSFVHVDDAAHATVLAVASDATGILNVVDDEPAPSSDWLAATARDLGVKAPHHVPAFLAKLAAGDVAVDFATRQRGASNARAKAALGWTPVRASWRGHLGR